MVMSHVSENNKEDPIEREREDREYCEELFTN